MLYVIPDTNVFIQCRDLKELPWKDLFQGVDEVTVVLIPPVMRELDRQKAGQGRVAKRARKFNSLLNDLLENDEVTLTDEKTRPRVKLTANISVRPDEILKDRLNYGEADGQIVGTVSTLMVEHLRDGVILLSRDTMVLTSAKSVGVDWRRVPDSWELPPENDAAQREINALKAEIRKLKEDAPNCEVELMQPRLECSLKKFKPLEDGQISLLMDRLERLYPIENEFGSRVATRRRVDPNSVKMMTVFDQEVFVPASEESISLYRENQYPTWVEKCREYFKNLHTTLQCEQSWPKIEFTLKNSGARPADDVQVLFKIMGDDLGFMRPKDDGSEDAMMIQLPSVPRSPQGYWKKAAQANPLGLSLGRGNLHAPLLINDDGILSSGNFPRLKSLMEDRDPNKFLWVEGGRGNPCLKASVKCQQWRHHAESQSFCFEVLAMPGQASIKGALTIEIHAANIAEPVTEAIPIHISYVEEDVMQRASELIDDLADPRRAGLRRPSP
ncbi:PIN domain-containing protein [Frateuria aurantia]